MSTGKLIVAGILAGVVLAVGVTTLALVIRAGTSKTESRSERGSADQLYVNQVEACETRGNESRENEVQLARILTRLERPALAAEAREVLHRLTGAAHANPDGTIRCQEAITKP